MQQMFSVATAIGQNSGGGGGGGYEWPEVPEELWGSPAAQALLSDALRQSLEVRATPENLP